MPFYTPQGNNMLSHYSKTPITPIAGDNNNAKIDKKERRDNRLVALMDKQRCTISIKNIDDNSVTPTNLDFFTTSVQENSQEKMQIIENYDNFNVYFMGRKPMLWNFGGVMRNDQVNNWSNEFDHRYETELRASILAKRRQRIILFYDSVILEGYIVQTGRNKQSSMTRAASFSFMFLVIDYKLLSYGELTDSILVNKEIIADT